MALACGHTIPGGSRNNPLALERLRSGLCPVCPDVEAERRRSPAGTVEYRHCSCCGEGWLERDGKIRNWVQL